ncbi:hypothetical protein K402DRAFT_388297 [Aulographum hederae CBS 113979]|uniref:Uncharacterized protein n=1 Tax=Aulographum hederae CBS 113979 TaxID=1176131 RepID=A0A6G1HHK8_9PEZI|nr:hypothetical protein K402DRAFT_388297 [Aulographum hederae CBS 113979]
MADLWSSAPGPIKRNGKKSSAVTIAYGTDDDENGSLETVPKHKRPKIEFCRKEKKKSSKSQLMPAEDDDEEDQEDDDAVQDEAEADEDTDEEEAATLPPLEFQWDPKKFNKFIQVPPPPAGYPDDFRQWVPQARETEARTYAAIQEGIAQVASTQSYALAHIEGMLPRIPVTLRQELYLELQALAASQDHMVTLASGLESSFEAHNHTLDRIYDFKVPLAKSALDAFQIARHGRAVAASSPDIASSAPVAPQDAAAAPKANHAIVSPPVVPQDTADALAQDTVPDNNHAIATPSWTPVNAAPPSSQESPAAIRKLKPIKKHALRSPTSSPAKRTKAAEPRPAIPAVLSEDESLKPIQERRPVGPLPEDFRAACKEIDELAKLWLKHKRNKVQGCENAITMIDFEPVHKEHFGNFQATITDSWSREWVLRIARHGPVTSLLAKYSNRKIVNEDFVIYLWNFPAWLELKGSLDERACTIAFELAYMRWKSSGLEYVSEFKKLFEKSSHRLAPIFANRGYAIIVLRHPEVQYEGFLHQLLSTNKNYSEKEILHQFWDTVHLGFLKSTTVGQRKACHGRILTHKPNDEVQTMAWPFAADSKMFSILKRLLVYFPKTYGYIEKNFRVYATLSHSLWWKNWMATRENPKEGEILIADSPEDAARDFQAAFPATPVTPAAAPE